MSAKIEQQDEIGYLSHENERLKSILNSLVEKAEKNQNIQQKFQSMEFEILSIGSLTELLDKLSIEFKNTLEVDAVNLHLFDPYGSAQDLLREIYPHYSTENIEFVENENDIQRFYPYGYQIQLRQKDYFLAKQLFPNQLTLQSFALIPLFRNGELVGSYHLASENSERFATGLQTDFYQHFSQIITVCIETPLNIEKLKHLSLIDPLTKVRNRRFLYKSLIKEISRVKRESQPLSCLFIDLDYFKKINDTFGHIVGDKTLKHVAKVIQPNLRSTDILARFGGEEFIALLPNCNETVATNIANRIRVMIENQTMLSDDQRAFRITCSIGGTTWIPEENEIKESLIAKSLIKLSDNAVYKAKASGRNQVIWQPFLETKANN